jgi:hypothetical protein
MTSTRKVKYKNISPTKENYASACNATIKYLFRYIYYRILFLLEKLGCYRFVSQDPTRGFSTK